MNIITIWSTALFLIIVFLAIANALNNETSNSNEANSQFECGFTIINPSHIPFSFQFFLVALLFLIFDIEIALVLSYPLEPNLSNTVINMTLFILVLTIGLIYEWQNSNLDWSN